MAARASRTPLSRERVLSAAVAIADAEGVKALTMRRLAAELDVEAMSLYHHVPAKEALLDGVVETVLGQICAAVADLDVTGDWRARLREQFLTARRVMLRHPWAPALLTSRRGIPPVVYGYFDGIVGTLVDAGFSYRIAHRAMHAFGSMSLGFVQEVFNPPEVDGGGESDAAEADLAAMAEAVPHLTAMVAAEAHAADDPTLGWCDSQVEYEFTLDLLLDGLDRLRDGTPLPG